MSRAPTGNNVSALTEQLESANDLIGLLKDQLRQARNENDATRQGHRLRINTIESEKAVMREELETLERLVERLERGQKGS